MMMMIMTMNMMRDDERDKINDGAVDDYKDVEGRQFLCLQLFQVPGGTPRTS